MMNLKLQQPLIGMMFSNADPRYADRLDDSHDTVTSKAATIM